MFEMLLLLLLLFSGVTQNSREHPRREPDFLNYPPAQRKQEHASVAVFPHADPKQSLRKHSGRGEGGEGGGRGGLVAAAGCCFHVADALNRRLENEKFNFLSDSRKRRRNPALSESAAWEDLIAVKVE